MSHRREVWTRAVAGALEAHAVAVEQMAPGHWTFAPVAPHTLHVSAQVAGEWLLFDAPLPAHVSRTLDPGWEALTANPFLTGGLKLCTAGGDRSLRLRAELPLLEDVPVAPRVQHVCAGLAAATAWMTTGQLDDTPPDPVATDDFEAADFDLQQRCRDTQWPVTLREPNTVMVQLDVPGAFQQAVVEMQPGCGVTICVPVLAEVPRPPVCKAAVARLLLATIGAVRMVRAAVGVSPDAAAFEVVLSHVPTVEELAHAFAALSLAWCNAGREAEVLARDERIARLYVDDDVRQRSGAVFESSTT